MIKIRHTGIVSYNLKSSIFFWKRLLGFKVANSQIESGKELENVLKVKNLKVKTIKLRDANKNLIELLFFFNKTNLKKKNIKTYSNGYTHISVTVKNINSICKKLKKYKIKLNSPPILSKDKKVKMTYCRTPEGAFLELVEEL